MQYRHSRRWFCWPRHGNSENMWHAAVALVVVASCVLVAGCAKEAGKAAMPKTASVMIPRPLVARELDSLLLTSDQVNVAIGSTAMAVRNTGTSMEDNSATMSPPECLALDGAAEADVYANSGFDAVRDQSMNDGDHFTHYLKQAVVLYSLVDQATAFVDHAAQQWRSCSDYTHVQSNSQWSVGPITYTNRVLSATVTEKDAAAPGWACGRALQVKNNVVIDINTCSANPADSASRIANQIADNVAAHW
jgi:PknH-like extracellular domain